MGQASSGDHARLAVPRLRGDRAGDLAPGSERRASGCSVPVCWGLFRAASSAARPDVRAEATKAGRPLAPTTVGPLALRWRALMLRILERCYWSVTIAGSMLLLAPWRVRAGPPRLAGRRDLWLDRRGPRRWAASGSGPRRTTPTPTSGRFSRGWTPPCCSLRSTWWRGGWASNLPARCG